MLLVKILKIILTNLLKILPNDTLSFLINSIKMKYNFYDEDYEIVLGSGSNGLIQNICKILLKENTNLITPYLSFGQPEFAATSFGAITKRGYLDNYDINFKYLEKAIDINTKLIYICNPSNPTGLIVMNKEIINFAKKYPNIYIMIDESNIEFSGISTYYTNKAISSNYYIKNVHNIKKELAFLVKHLKELGIETLKTYSNTIFTSTAFKNEFINELFKHNISGVPIKDQNEKLHLRIACQNHKTNRMFIMKLSRIKDIEKLEEHKYKQIRKKQPIQISKK